jgi:hypothetical protein
MASTASLRCGAHGKWQHHVADRCHVLYRRWNRTRSGRRAPGWIDYFSIDHASRRRSASLHLALNWAALYYSCDQYVAEAPSADGELLAAGECR